MDMILMEKMVYAALFSGGVSVDLNDGEPVFYKDGKVWNPDVNDDCAMELGIKVLDHVDLGGIEKDTLRSFLLADGVAVRRGIIHSASLIGKELV